MSRLTDESKLPLGWLHNMLNFLTLRMRSKMSVCAQMSRLTDKSKLLQYTVEFYQFAHAQ